MVSRRKQTSLPNEQPVRFYKIIALTFLALTLVLFGAVIFLSSQRAVITLETKANPLDANQNVVVGDSVDNPQVSAVVTTTLITVRGEVVPTGTKEEPAIATGMVTLHNESGQAQPLVEKTRLLSEKNILFRLRSSVNIPANGTLEAEVYADQPGSSGNIEASRFTIPGLAESRQKVVYATSKDVMTGGVKNIGALSQSDVDEAEKKLTATVENQVKTQLGSIYPGKEMLVSVLRMEKVLSAKVGDSISSASIEGMALVAVVVYDKNEVKTWAEQAIQNQSVGDTQIIRPSSGEATVTLKEYNEEKNQATLHIFSAGTATVNAESKQLEKSMFFGKTKDEVKRYGMSLEHVSSVNVEFHPFWMQTVPHIHDHVQVIVKEVQ